MTVFCNDACMEAAEFSGFAYSAGVGNNTDLVDHVFDIVGYAFRFYCGHQAFL